MIADTRPVDLLYDDAVYIMYLIPLEVTGLTKQVCGTSIMMCTSREGARGLEVGSQLQEVVGRG